MIIIFVWLNFLSVIQAGLSRLVSYSQQKTLKFLSSVFHKSFESFSDSSSGYLLESQIFSWALLIANPRQPLHCFLC